MDAFAKLQRERLQQAWAADLPDSTTSHVVVALPSYSVDRTLLDHYGDRVPALETRYAYVALRARDPHTRVIYLASLPLGPAILDGYLRLLDPSSRAEAAASTLFLSANDTSRRSLAEKLLDDGRLVDAMRRFIGEEPALIEAWNVTESEAALAVALGVPINGTPPHLRSLATKSEGRKLLRQAGVPVPPGVEDVRTVENVVAAIDTLRQRGTGLKSVVVKLDDSVAGDGNVLIELRPGEDLRALERRLTEELPDWYRASLAVGGVVEERVVADLLRSPSAQASITPTGDVQVLATHEQRLGGANGHVFEGSTFPADAAYAPRLGEYTARVGSLLAQAGAIGRFSVDFVSRERPDGGWDLFGLEINLRKGGTTHTLGITRLLTGASYDPSTGHCTAPDGQGRCYTATDNLVRTEWLGRPPLDALDCIDAAGLQFHEPDGMGVVLHLLDCLRVDGRMGYTCIGRTAEEAEEFETRAVEVLSR